MAEEFKGLNKETLKNVESIKSSMLDIAKATATANKNLGDVDGYLTAYQSVYKSINESADKFSQIQLKASKSAKATTEAFKEQQKQLSVVKTINAQIDNLYVSMGKASEGQVRLLKRQVENLSSARDNAKELAGVFGNLVDDSARLDKSTKYFSALSEVAKDIPGLRKLASPFEAASIAARETVIFNLKNQGISQEMLKTGKGLTKEKIQQLGLEKETAGLTGFAAARKLRNAGFVGEGKEKSATGAGLKAGFTDFKDSALALPAALGIAEKIVKFIIDAMLGASKMQADIAKSFNVTYEAAKKIRKDFNDLKREAKSFVKDVPEGFTILQEELTEANFQFNRLTGQAVNLLETNKELNVQFSYYTKALGLSEVEQKALLDINAQTGASVQDTTRSILGQTSLYKKLTGYQIDERKVLRDVLSTSNSIKLSIKGGTEALIQASINAGKLGTNLEGLKSTSNALLNFEQSINDELSAELLLGRDINLDAARQAALTNDQLGLTEEVGKLISNFGPDFQKNALAQEAFAKTLGKSKEEIADMYTNYQLIEKNRKAQTSLGEDEIKQLRDKMGLTKTQEAQLRTGGLAGVEFYDILKAAGYEGKELTETLAGLSVETLATQSAEQKFNDAISSLKETLVDLVGTGVMDKLVNGLSALAETLASGGSLYTLNPLGESDLTKNLNKKNDEYIVKQDKAIEDKIAAGTELNDAEKKRAVIIERNNKLLSEKGGSMGSYKDVITFNREFGVDKFDESLAAEEVKEEERMKKDRSFAKGGIVPSGYPNDTYRARLSSGEAVVPLDAFYSKLDTLISAVEQGGNIYLETDKVGTAHNKSTFKLNK